MISVSGSQAIMRAAGLRSRILPLVSMTTIPSLIARKICGYATGSIKKSWYRKRPSARITPTHAKAKGVRSSPRHRIDGYDVEEVYQHGYGGSDQEKSDLPAVDDRGAGIPRCKEDHSNQDQQVGIRDMQPE